MKLKKLLSIIAIHALTLTGGFYIGYIYGQHQSFNPEHQCLYTSQECTNSLQRINKPQAPGWFKETSNYIWDGWKIK